jgi:ketosteroid isomerase-like protein
MKELEELNAGYIRSVATSDVAWFDRHLADDFVNSNADGTLSDRAAFLAAIAKPLPLKDFACEDVRIRVFGDAAIIHARTTYRKPDGQRGAGRYTDVWARRGGRWVCVCADVTRT